jgi:hypothetical protein
MNRRTRMLLCSVIALAALSQAEALESQLGASQLTDWLSLCTLLCRDRI